MSTRDRRQSTLPPQERSCDSSTPVSASIKSIPIKPHSLSKDEIILLQDAFHQSGGLRDSVSIINLLRTLGQNLSASELDCCLREVEFVEGSVMTLSMFLHLMSYLKDQFVESTTTNEASDAFVSLGGNYDKSGDVDAGRLRQAFKDFSLHLDIEPLIKQHDTTHTGQLKYHQFEALFEHFHEEDSDEANKNAASECSSTSSDSEESLAPEIVSRMQSMHRLGLKVRDQRSPKALRKHKQDKETKENKDNSNNNNNHNDKSHQHHNPNQIPLSISKDSAFHPQDLMQALLNKHDLQWKKNGSSQEGEDDREHQQRQQRHQDDDQLTHDHDEDDDDDDEEDHNNDTENEDVQPFDDALHLFSPSQSVIGLRQDDVASPSPTSNIGGGGATNKHKGEPPRSHSPRWRKEDFVSTFTDEYGVKQKVDKKHPYRDHTLNSLNKISAVSPNNNNTATQGSRTPKPPPPTTSNKRPAPRNVRKTQHTTNNTEKQNPASTHKSKQRQSPTPPQQQHHSLLRSNNDTINILNQLPVLGRTYQPHPPLYYTNTASPSSTPNNTNNGEAAGTTLPAIATSPRPTGAGNHSIAAQLAACSAGYTGERSQLIQDVDACYGAKSFGKATKLRKRRKAGKPHSRQKAATLQRKQHT